MHLPRFQFRLRTLLIGVALLGVVCAACAYVVHQREIVQQRKNWGMAHMVSAIQEPTVPREYVLSAGDPKLGPGQIRLWLGDGFVKDLQVYPNESDAFKQAAIRLFPEAKIWEYRPNKAQ